MRKLHSLAFYALITPAITLSSGAVFAAEGSNGKADMGEQSLGHDAASEMQGSEQDQDSTKSVYNSTQSEHEAGGQSDMQSQGYMDSAPANGMQASNLIGTDLKTSDDEKVGEIGDLIIDKNGQVVAVVVSVGSFLGMGEKHVAIAWDDITKSGTSDEKQELRVDVTRDELQSAPEFKKQD